MTERRPRQPRYGVVATDDALADISGLSMHGPEVLAAVVAIIDDLAFGRVVGKALGARNVSGDLTGYARIKFDVAGERPQRFRLLYRQVDDDTREITAVGLRDEHAIYRLAASRLGERPSRES